MLAWHIYQGVLIHDEGTVGKNQFITHIADIPEDGWISSRTRQPTEADADVQKCILAEEEGIGVRLLHLSLSEDTQKYPRWHRMPDGPKDE